MTRVSPPVKSADPSDQPPKLTADELRRALRANENAEFKRVGNTFVEAVLFQSGAKTIEPLKGLPLRVLDLGACKAIADISALQRMPLKRLILEDTSVSDISALAGMKLELLYLQNTTVKDLSVLKGMPIEQLNLMNVPVSDLSVAAGMPLSTLWIPGTQVTDLSPLKDVRLESLDVEELPLTDFSVIADMTSLKRLNIAGTPLRDVSILSNLKLDRITLTPDTIDAGMDVLRNMSSLTQVWVSTGLGAETQQFNAADFWKRYDDGTWANAEEPPPDNGATDDKE